MSEVNTNLAYQYFVTKTAVPQLEFRRLLAKALIYNEYLLQEEREAGDQPFRGRGTIDHIFRKIPKGRGKWGVEISVRLRVTTPSSLAMAETAKKSAQLLLMQPKRPPMPRVLQQSPCGGRDD